jgi:hypothetical protein
MPDKLRAEAESAYEVWIAGEAGPAYAGDKDVKDGFIDGYMARAYAENSQEKQ